MWPRNKYRRPWTNTSDNQALFSQKRRSDKIRAALSFPKGFSRRMHGCDLCSYRLNICTSSAILTCRGKAAMATVRNRTHKHFQLDSVKIKRAQKVLRAKTETEAIEGALDLAIAEHER